LLPLSTLLFLILFAPQTDRVSFRLITVPSEAKAVELRARVLAGESFGSVAKENSTDSSARAGGFMGVFASADLRQEFRSALSGLKPGELSPVLKLGNNYFFVQLVDAAEAEWSVENAAGLDQLQKGRHAEAARSFSRAVELAEKFGPDDDRLGESLNGLAEAYRLQENFAGTESVYRRVLAIRWSAASNKGNTAVAELVDRFADVLILAYFKGNQFDGAVKKYGDALRSTPVSEALYVSMSSLLVKAELTTVAEDVMRKARESYPSSRRIRYKEAEMYRDSGKMRKALDTFQQASQMKPPAGMPQELDRSQLSFIYQRMGGINTDLTQFDEAIAAYKKSLEISPDNADARISLGDLYLRRGQHEEALDEFKRVLAAHPDKALPHYRVADANLQMGNFSDAVAEASRALRIDPQLQKARYVNGLALMRMGRSAEGQQELQEYGKQEAAAQAELDRQRGIVVSNRGAAALVTEGKADEGIALFRTSIGTNPKEPSLRFNLGLALNMSNRFAEAASTLQSLLDSGMSDGSLIYKALARTYENLKDERNASKYKAQFVQRIDGALEEELK